MHGILLLFLLTPLWAIAQIQFRRTSSLKNSWVRLTNLDTDVSTEQAGDDGWFDLSAGLYFVEAVSSDDTVIYREIEFINNSSPRFREVRRGHNVDVGFILSGDSNYDIAYASQCRNFNTLVDAELSRFGLVHLNEVEKIPLQQYAAYPCGPSSQAFFGSGSTRGYSITATEENIPDDLSTPLVVPPFAKESPIWMMTCGERVYISNGFSRDWQPEFVLSDETFTISELKGYLPHRYQEKARPAPSCSSGPLRFWTIRIRALEESEETVKEYLRHWPQAFSFGQVDVKEFKKSIDRAVTRIEEDFKNLDVYEMPSEQGVALPHHSAALVKLLRASALSNPEPPGAAYLTDNFSAVLRAATTDVASALTSTGLEGLARYFDDRQRSITLPTARYIATAEARRVYRTFVGIVKNLGAAANDISVTLHFDTLPGVDTDDALLELQLSNDRLQDVYSQGGVRNLYRGLYQYRVTKPGFWTATGHLDLVDQPANHLVCTLEKKANSARDPGASKESAPRDEQNRSICKQL